MKISYNSYKDQMNDAIVKMKTDKFCYNNFM